MKRSEGWLEYRVYYMPKLIGGKEGGGKCLYEKNKCFFRKDMGFQGEQTDKKVCDNTVCEITEVFLSFLWP